ncbi:hypothetical protein WR25_16057 [Diploscapter pachys]|uniref:Ubiquitin carboxyl-terminal hydrolase 7 n=1 Tax=Diploscapter pachys TaxID=2018661 RepID=A0A2A2KJ09_9BILA|nr:hypothetical protein WR25_16057 [Diploscapter pachys]
MSDEVVKMNARDKPMDIEETEIDVGTGPGDDADPQSPNSQPVRTESGPLLYSGQFPGGQSVLPVAAVAPMHQQMDDMTAESEDNNEPIAIDIPNNDEDSQMDNPISTEENETTCGERTTTFWESSDMSRDFRGNATGVDSTSDFEDRPHPTQKKKFKCLQFEDEEDDPDDPFKSEGTIYLEIDCFSQFAVGSAEAQQRLSKPIYVRGLPWKILAIPRETRETTKSGQAQKCLGFFLQCNGDSDLVSWNCMATATLKVLGKDGEDHKRKIAHTFYPKENDWGYSQFLTCEQLKNELYCQDDTIRLMVQVSADAPHGVQWDSKAHTGFIGLKNQGATCYMNSILQTFFFTNKLRKAVYEMPVSDEPVEANVGLAMQRVFYDLQYSDKPVGTKKLTKSFGWDSIETFMQHDVQELCRVLLDNLENKMKGTPVAETIPWLFKGKMKSFIKCTDVDFESSRVEDFYDIQLNIRSKHDGYGRHQEISSNPGFNLMDSFREYTEVERLDGDNKYDAGEYGMQPAEKGVKFVSFPPVLHLQLMRFQYDPQLDQNVKINDRFVFPDRLNLAEFVENADGPQEDYQYILQAVLVHTGDFHGGHYVVFINTNAKAPLEGAKSRWCKFDDDVVSRAKAKDAIIANYGGDDSETPNKTYTSAYMLVYVRESTISDVLCDVADNDIPDYLKQRFEAEKTEETRKKKEKSEAHLYTELSILTEDVILGHHGFDLFDTATLEEVEKREKIEKKISFRHLYEVLADRVYSSENQKVHPSEFRLWKFEENNFKDEHTAMSLSRLRPATLLPYTGEDSEKSLETTLDSEKTILFLEEVNLRTRLLPEYNDNSILMFFKYYDDLTQTLSVVGHLIINYKKPLNAVQDLCCDMARIARGTKLKFYEEISADRIRFISTPEQPVCNEPVLAELVDGGLIIFERAEHTSDHNNAKKYLESVYDRIEIEAIHNSDSFVGISTGSEETTAVNGVVCLSWNMKELVEYLGNLVNFNPAQILLWRLSQFNDRPTQSITDSQGKFMKVRDLLGLSGPHVHDPRRHKRYKVIYTKMPIRVDEMERRKQIKVQVMDDKMKITEMTMFPEKSGTVASLLQEAVKEFKFPPNGSGKLRLVYVGTTLNQMRVFNVFPENAPILEISQKALSPSIYAVRIEEIPVDQADLKSGEMLIPVSHFDKDPQRMFGTPFFVKVVQDEPLCNIKERIQKMLDVPDKEYEKYRFALMSNNRVVRYLEMDSTHRVNLNDLGYNISQGFQTSAVPPLASSPYLAIEHINKLRGARGGHTAEKSIVIKN